MTKRNLMINGSDIKRNGLITVLTIIPFNGRTDDNNLDTNRISPKLFELIDVCPRISIISLQHLVPILYYCTYPRKLSSRVSQRFFAFCYSSKYRGTFCKDLVQKFHRDRGTICTQNTLLRRGVPF